MKKNKTFRIIVVIIALALILGGLYLWYSRRQAQESAALKQAAANQSAQTSEDTEQQEITGISVRGDSFNSDESDKTTGYPEVLQGLLTNAGISLTVNDNTWGMSGTLSQMALAGVSDDTIQGYIDAHKQKGFTSDYETTVRSDLDQYKTDRTDQNGIPVICMGYNGGWGRDVTELTQQIQAILDTYSQKDKYVVVGYPPKNVSSMDDYNTAMQNAFGDHYVLLNLNSAAMTSSGRSEIAQQIYQKLSDLGYLQQ